MKYGFKYDKGSEVEQETYDNLTDAVDRFMLTWAKLTDEEREAIKMAGDTFCCTMYVKGTPMLILDGYDLRRFEEGRACLIMEADRAVQSMHFPNKDAYRDAILRYIQEGKTAHSFGDVTLILDPSPESAVEPTEDEIKAMGSAALTDGSE